MNIFSSFFFKALLFFFPAGAPSFLKNIPLIRGYFAHKQATQIPALQPDMTWQSNSYAQEMVTKCTKNEWTLFIPLSSYTDYCVNNGTVSFTAFRADNRVLSYVVTPDKAECRVTVVCRDNGSEIFSRSFDVFLRKQGYSVSTKTIKNNPRIMISYDIDPTN
jgi:hypothetical protein